MASLKPNYMKLLIYTGILLFHPTQMSRSMIEAEGVTAMTALDKSTGFYGLLKKHEFYCPLSSPTHLRTRAPTPLWTTCHQATSS